LKNAFLSSKSTSTDPSSFGRIFLSSDAGFLGRIKD
jgi:hypothetical protein